MSSEKKGQDVGILGAGFVGSVLKKYYPRAAVFDIKQGNWNPLKEVLSRKVIFVAINLHDNGSSDVSLASLRSYLNNTPEGRIVVIKSTLIPGTAEMLQREYPNLKICYNPEFLTESTAWEDFRRPLFQIVGVTEKSRRVATKLLEILPAAPVMKIIGVREAETLKHAINSYFSMKVVFFNELYDACEKLGVDYEAVRELLVKHPSVGDSHSVIWHKGYRGFGGKCLPKDISAFAELSQSSLLIKVIQINEQLSLGSPSRATRVDRKEKVSESFAKSVTR